LNPIGVTKSKSFPIGKAFFTLNPSESLQNFQADLNWKKPIVQQERQVFIRN